MLNFMVSPILRMQKISKRFPGVIALDAVELEVFPGEVLALAGENGAGKSTLMKILGGIYQPESGAINIDGKPTAIRSVSDATANGIGFVHQELNVLDNLTVAENIYLGREPRRAKFLIDRSRLNADSNVYLKRLGLDISPRTQLMELSIAQQQMVEIAKALSQNARIVIMDEPTSSLTLTETERLLSVIGELRAQGVSVIYISHRLSEIKQIADRVVVLRDGKNAGILLREEINHDAIVSLMVGRNLQKLRKHSEPVERKPFASVRDLRTRRFPACSNSFDIRSGEILGFAGLVGSGRSETAQAIFGIDRALKGDVLLDGKPIAITKARDAINNGIYLVPEDRRTAGLIMDIPIRANITLPALSRYASAGLVSRSSETKMAGEMCNKLNIKAPSGETKAANLSGGNQQKVVLAKWLSLGPKLMIFDEPTRGIDVGAKAEIYELMRKLAASGVAIIMISSDMEEILSESDRVAVMYEGTITGILDRADATEESIMKLAVGH